MIIITVNCNDDNLTIEYDTGESLVLSRIPIVYTLRICEIFQNLIKLIDKQTDTPIGIKLIKIDEDTSTTIGEW